MRHRMVCYCKRISSVYMQEAGFLGGQPCKGIIVNKCMSVLVGVRVTVSWWRWRH